MLLCKIRSKSNDFICVKVYFSKMQTVLCIGMVFPESNSTAAGSRMLQIITFFRENKYQVVFASAAQMSPFSDNLAHLDVIKTNIQLNHKSFDIFIKELDPAIVVFDRFISEEQFGWRVAENCPNAIRILDTEDLHCLRIARHEAFKKEETFKISSLFDLDITKREIASIYRCDLSLMISSVEMEILTTEFDISSAILFELPVMLDTISDEERLNKSTFKERVDFIGIGNFKHEPNWQSVLYLKNTIWTLIRKQLPEAQLLIYGAYASQKVSDLHNERDHFIVKGRAENAQEVISKAKILLAPLQFGAGLKGKLIDAMQCGTPSVTTTIGAESMHGNLPWNGFIEDNAEQFAKKAIELYTNKEAWRNAQQNGYEIINHLYDKNELSTKLLQRIIHIQENLKSHRTKNFTGSLLQHHTLQSTRYLSKWIQEKNKS